MTDSLPAGSAAPGAPEADEARHRLERDLEFDQLLAEAQGLCRSSSGRAGLAALGPFETRAAAEAELRVVDEMRTLAARSPELVVWPTVERPTLERLRLRGSVLTAEALCTVRATLRTVRELKNAFRRSLPDGVERLAAEVECLPLQPELLEALTRALEDDGAVREDASPELAFARRRERELRSLLEASLERVMRLPDNRECFGDTFVTTINDRYVIPVLTDFRGRIRGVVQGSSGTGHTVFMEPLHVVEQNNELMEVLARAQAEEARILAALSDQARNELPSLELATETLSWFDGLAGRARWAELHRAVVPAFAEGLALEVREGRHPLLGEACVPVNLALAPGERVVVISGANSGGKTVTLKIVGLLALLARRGWHVPAAHGTKVPFFGRIFMEIGDRQSLAEHLSSFSSHARDVGRIVAAAADGDLVLLDELMTGTDPEEGAVLAEAVLEALGRRQLVALATTHYGRLKLLTKGSPAFKNVAVEFDRRSLRPTYKLLPGLPGASCGFEIAGRFGMSEALVGRARELLGEGRNRLTELIQDLEGELRAAREAAALRGRELEELARLRADLERRERDFEDERHGALEEEVARSREALLVFRRDVEARLQQLSAEVARSAAAASAGAAGAEPPVEAVREARRELTRAVEDRLRELKPPPPPSSADVPLAVGDRVRVPGTAHVGRVVDLERDGETLRVDVNGMTVTFPRREVERAGPEPAPPRKRARTDPVPASMTLAQLSSDGFKLELDLRGKRASEALEELESYLDRSLARNLQQVRVIHGKGTGTLRREVERYLKEHPAVLSFRLGGQGEGDFGVTVVTFR